MTQAFVYKWIHQPTGMWYIDHALQKDAMLMMGIFVVLL